ncbi:MAG TPA: pitrilysin family protein [Burkholderiaceae bacterium]|nr:pitrilysin family protein [Burkholderiaceae bacterium]
MSLRSIGRRALLASSLALLGAGAGAQSFDTPPTPGAPRPLAIDAPVEQRLPNGLRIVLAERRGVQLVTAQLVVLSGAEVDPPGRAGLASMTANLLTKGTKRHSATALARAAESLGGALDSSAGWHQSSVGITVTLPKLDAALALVSEVVQQPALAADELERLRVQSLDELKVAYSQPGTLASLAAQRLLYGDGAYGHPSGGTPTSLASLTRTDLLALHRARYRPDNAVLVLAGDLSADAALKLAQRHFGAWRGSGEAPAPVAALTAAELPQAGALIELPKSGQAAVVVATPLPPLGADRAAAAVMNAVLGGGYSSRLNQEIRIRRGLSYSAYSGIDARPGGASLRAVVQTKNESAAEVVALVRAELDRLAAQPVTDAELAARKATLIGDFGRSVETTSGLAAALRSLVVGGLPPADLRRRIDALSVVSAADVQRYAAANLNAATRRVAVAGDAPAFAEALGAALPGLVTVPAGRLDLDRGAALMAP